MKKNKTNCHAGPKKNVISRHIFKKELDLCKKLNRESGGKGCCWGKCKDCGAIPFLYKLQKGVVIDDKEELKKIREGIFGK